MKLRIKGNSIRLRLGRSEVRRLATEGIVEESTAFGASQKERLGYSIRASPEFHIVSTSFADRRIVVCVPRSLVQSWAATDQVGIQTTQSTGAGELQILIEKDFECIEPMPGESQEDAFPRPLTADACPPGGR